MLMERANGSAPGLGTAGWVRRGLGRRLLTRTLAMSSVFLDTLQYKYI